MLERVGLRHAIGRSVVAKCNSHSANELHTAGASTPEQRRKEDARRSAYKHGRAWGDGRAAKVLWDVVRTAAKRAEIDKLAPHDLRRACARLCHVAGGALDQIQFLLAASPSRRPSATSAANRNSDMP